MNPNFVSFLQGQARPNPFQQFLQQQAPGNPFVHQLQRFPIGAVGGHPPIAGGVPQGPPPPPAPTIHNGNPMTPLRAVFQDLQQGLNPSQMANILAGRVPGHENGDFMNVNRHGDVVSLIAQMLSKGGQGLPGTYDAFARYINNGLAGNQHVPGGDVGHIRPPVNPGIGIIRRNAPRPPIMRQQMLQHFLQRAVR